MWFVLKQRHLSQSLLFFFFFYTVSQWLVENSTCWCVQGQSEKHCLLTVMMAVILVLNGLKFMFSLQLLCLHCKDKIFFLWLFQLYLLLCLFHHDISSHPVTFSLFSVPSYSCRPSMSQSVSDSCFVKAQYCSCIFPVRSS